jgi:hypothetical protein
MRGNIGKMQEKRRKYTEREEKRRKCKKREEKV